MLFPLSKSFSSSGLFQRGVNSEPEPRRVWAIDSTGSSDRALELHRILTERKPFAEHLQLVRRRAEEGKRQDLECCRAHKDVIKGVQQRLDEQAAEGRRQMQENARNSRLRRAQSDAGIAQTMKDQHDSFQAWRTDMETRVRSQPPLCGDLPPRESEERATTRTNGPRAVSQGTSQYFEEQRAVKQRIAERKPFSAPVCSGKPQHLIIEERKVAGLAQLSQTHREYERHLEGLYDKHGSRVMEERRRREADYAASVAHKSSLLSASATLRGDTLQRSRHEQLEREERVRSRPKGFAGYAPKVKSDRRLRNEAVDQEMNKAATAPTDKGRSSTGNTTLPKPEERTLSPRTLGLNA